MSAPEIVPLTTEAGPTDGHWLQPLTENWITVLCRLLEQKRVVVRVLLAQIQGSAPREPGACMLIADDVTLGTIGGGALEQHAIYAAREIFHDARGMSVRLRRLVLSRELAQCCGGVVQLCTERFTRADMPWLRAAERALLERRTATITMTVKDSAVARQLNRSDDSDHGASVTLRIATQDEFALQERIDANIPAVWVYGAGHVGQALIRVLADLPLQVTWIDCRPELLPAALPSNVRAMHAAHPLATVLDAPAATRFVVLTHDHGLDYELCRAILARGDFTWLGLIGSKSKAAKFRARLVRDAVAPERITRLTCPMGVGGIASKWPAAIAIGIAAQLLQTFPQSDAIHPLRAVAEIDPHAECSAANCANCASRRESAREH